MLPIHSRLPNAMRENLGSHRRNNNPATIEQMIVIAPRSKAFHAIPQTNENAVNVIKQKYCNKYIGNDCAVNHLGHGTSGTNAHTPFIIIGKDNV